MWNDFAELPVCEYLNQSLKCVTGGPRASLLSQPASVAASHCGVCSREGRIQRRQAYEVSIAELRGVWELHTEAVTGVWISKSQISKPAVPFTFLYLTFTSPPPNYVLESKRTFRIAVNQPATMVGCLPNRLFNSPNLQAPGWWLVWIHHLL